MDGMEEKVKITGATGLLTVTPPPHIKRPSNARTIMLEVMLALVPALGWGAYIFGLRALVLVLLCVGFSVLFELLFEKMLHRPVTVGDFSAAVTGLLLGMNLPVTAPLWITAVGSAFAIIVVKQLFGGIGKNFLNPALAARAFLFLSWPDLMSGFTAAYDRVPVLGSGADAVASATVLTQIKSGVSPDLSVLDAFLGKCGGTIGEISAVLLIAGGLYLLVRGIIQWQIPTAYLGTCAALFFAFPQVGGGRLDAMLIELLSGGLMLGAIYMATDYVTSPITKWGRALFGVGCGLLTFFFRVFGANAEGVSFSILIMNCLVWYIDRATKPKVFGGVRREK